MSFAWHHPSYYKKLKQNSRRSYGIGSSKDTVSEANLSPQTMETEKVGHVDRLSSVPQRDLSSIHTDQKEKNET